MFFETFLNAKLAEYKPLSISNQSIKYFRLAQIGFSYYILEGGTPYCSLNIREK